MTTSNSAETIPVDASTDNLLIVELETRLELGTPVIGDLDADTNLIGCINSKCSETNGSQCSNSSACC